MLSREDNETLSASARTRRWASCSACIGSRSFPAKDLMADGQPKRIKLLGEDLVAFRDTEGRVGLLGNACAHRGAPMMYGAQRGLRAALRLSRLEVRRDRRGRRHAGRAGALAAQGARAHQGLSLSRARRRRVDLHGARKGAAAAAEPRVQSGAGGARLHLRTRAGVQLAAGARGRDRQCARADPAWPHRSEGRHQRLARQAGPAADVRMHAAERSA